MAESFPAFLRTLERSIQPLEGLAGVAPPFRDEDDVEPTTASDLAFVLRDLRRAAAGARALITSTNLPESDDDEGTLVIERTQLDDAAPTVPYASQPSNEETQDRAVAALQALVSENRGSHLAIARAGSTTALVELLTSKPLKQIAADHGRTVEEVALRWNVQSGFPVTTRVTADYAPNNTPNGTSHCTDDCSAAIGAMAEVDEWSLSADEMATLDDLRFTNYTQSPTYYSSAGCNASFGVSEHPVDSACVLAESAWC